MKQRIKERYLNYFISDEQLKRYLDLSVITQNEYDAFWNEKHGLVIPEDPPTIVIPDGTETDGPIQAPVDPPVNPPIDPPVILPENPPAPAPEIEGEGV